MRGKKRNKEGKRGRERESKRNREGQGEKQVGIHRVRGRLLEIDGERGGGKEIKKDGGRKKK